MKERYKKDIDMILDEGGTTFRPELTQLIPGKYGLYIQGAKLLWKLTKRLFKKKSKKENINAV